MELQTFQYYSNTGWSTPFPDLDSEQTLIIVFAAPSFINNLAPLQELSHHYPRSKIIGCSTAGEIAGAQITDESLSIAVIRFNKTNIKIIKEPINQAGESFAAGKKISSLLDKTDLKGIFVLSEGINVNGSELVKGLNSINKKVVVTGGLAGDGKRFKQTWELFNGEITTNTVVAVGLYGDNIQIGHASQGGWDIFGPERRITRSKNNILYELDDKPALALYKEYLGERASGLPATGLLFPLAIRKDSQDTKQLVRTILAVDEDSQALIFAGDVPKGYLAQLMRANFDRLISCASEASSIATKDIPYDDKGQFNSPLLCIAISCVGRRLLLGERTEEETESVLENLPKGSRQIGFYSYGELSPYSSGTCDLHNQTMTITTIWEK